ncbi:MAG: hypothetical protein Q9157_007695, partial [Trypethelium eluteriae]
MQFVSETETDSDSSSHGVLIDSTGDVVIKPCTEAEIDFYEKTLQLHRDFAAHMPTYMGQVRLKNPEESIKTGPAIARSPKLSRAPTLPSQNRPTSGSTSEAVPPPRPFPAPADTTGDMTQRNKTNDNNNSKGKSGTKDDSNNDHHHAAVSSTPGTTLPSTALETETAIVLENLAAGFVRPNILDIKLGARLWADDAPLEKRARLDAVAASTTSGSLGFRVAGMRVWRGRPAGAVPPSERIRPGDT